MKKFIFTLIVFLSVNLSFAQDIPQHISYTRIYDFIDELANDGFIELNSVIKPIHEVLFAVNCWKLPRLKIN